MHSVNRFTGFRDPGLQHSSVRRYNVDFCQVYRPPESLLQDGSGNLRLYVVARRNSVANLQSYMPYDMYTHVNDWLSVQDKCSVADDDIFDRGISSSEDDRSPYSERGASPFIANHVSSVNRGRFPSVTRAVSPQYPGSARRWVTRVDQHVSPVHFNDETTGVDLQPQDEGPAYDYAPGLDATDYHGISPEAILSRSPQPQGSRNVSFAKSVLSASPKLRNKRTISGSRGVEHLSPTGYSPFASFGAVYSSGLENETTQDMSAATANNLATIELLKKRHSGKSSKRSPSILSSPPGSGSGRGKASKSSTPGPDGIEMRIGGVADYGAVDDYGAFEMQPFADDGGSTFVGEPPMAGPMQTSDLVGIEAPHLGARGRKASKSSGGPVMRKGSPRDRGLNGYGAKGYRGKNFMGSRAFDAATDQGVQTQDLEYHRTSLGVGGDDFDLDEYGNFSERLGNGHLGLEGAKKPYQRRIRKPVNSAMLLNSWYISYGDERKRSKKRYEHVEPYVDRNRRYPTRSRLPPIQHWNSNMTADGTSVLFLIGVTSDDQKLGVQAQHASGDVVIYNDESNFLDGSSTLVRIPTEEMPEASLVLTDSHGVMEMQVIEPSADRPLAIANKPPDSARKRGPSTESARRHGAIADKPGLDHSKALAIEGPPTSRRPPSARGKKTGTKQKKGKSSKKNREMTVREALEILKSDSVGSLGLETSVEHPPEEGSPKSRRQTDFYQEMTFQPAKRGNLETLPPDSVTMQDGKQIAYRSFFRVGEVESQLYNGSIFQPMIMNSRCRSSNVIIPIGRHVDMGNVKANFICGYLYSGEDVVIRGLGISWTLKQKHTFFLPMFEEWSIHNDSPSMDANIALTFVTI